MGAAEAAARLRRRFGWDSPAAARRPALILLSGLPGTGKSYLAAAIATRFGALVVRSDEVRKALVPAPQYTDRENGFVYLTCYALLDQLLRDGHAVVFDATNLQRSGRSKARRIATGAGAPMLLLVTTAPPEVVAERLRQRAAGAAEAYSSDADWDVHQKLAATMESMERPNLEVDSSRDLTDALDAVERFLCDHDAGGDARPLAAEEVAR